jgi:hypothetical protein
MTVKYCNRISNLPKFSISKACKIYPLWFS